MDRLLRQSKKITFPCDRSELAHQLTAARGRMNLLDQLINER
ncbi:MAG: hypothetical protein Q4D56_14250 [Bacteroides sp.]|nr:hypothetical protein [Bacteroides sp.]